MKRPIAAAGHATALVLALAAGASHRQSLPLASADAVPTCTTSTPHPASLASSTWKQFEATTAMTATAPAASVGGHHPHRRHGGMSVKEGGGRDASKRGNGPAGAVGGLWDNLRRRPRDREEEDDEDNQKKKEEDGDDAKDDVDRKDQGPAEATDTIKDDGSGKDDESGKDDDVDKNAMPTEQQQQQQPQPSPGIQRTPMYIVRPRPPAGLPNHPGTSPLGGLLLPSGVGSGIGDPSSSQTVQSALLSALTKLLIATLLTPGGLRNSPLLGWLLPRRSGERPYLPDPVQRYTFERLNDRYERDGAALERALLETAPAADRVGHYFWGRGRSRRRRRRRHHHHRRHHRHRSPSQQEKSGRHRKAAETSGGVEGTASSTIDNSRWQPRPQPQPQERGEHRTVIVLDFCTDPNSPSARHLPTPGHTHAPAEGHAAPHDPVELLRDQVSFVLEQYHDPTVRSLLGRQVEVVLRVESGGGGVQHFGVAADAVRRIRDAAADTAAAGAPSSSDATRVDASGSSAIAADESSTAGTPTDGPAAAAAKEDDIILTVCVDRIAASGGYMVAAQASRGRLFAAPFALVGSIGVYTERVNIHDALTRLGVRGLVLKAGKSKAPIGTIGEVSESGINAVQEDLDRVHDAFRSLVKDSRQVENGEALSSVMEGECFLGNYAQELGLVDRTITSDAYIAERVLAGDKVLRLRRYDKPKAFGGLNLPLSPLDLLLSGGASEDLFGRLKSKVKGALSAVNIADAVKFAGIIAGSLTFLKDFQHGGGHYAKTTGPQARYTQGK